MDLTEAAVLIVLIIAVAKCGDNRCEKEPCSKVEYNNNEYSLCEGDTLRLDDKIVLIQK